MQAKLQQFYFRKAVAEIFKINVFYVTEAKVVEDSPGCIMTFSLAVPENNLSIQQLDSIVASEAFSARLEAAISKNGGSSTVDVLDVTVKGITPQPSPTPTEAPTKVDPSISVYIGVVAGAGAVIVLVFISTRAAIFRSFARLFHEPADKSKSKSMSRVYPEDSFETYIPIIPSPSRGARKHASARVHPALPGEEEKQPNYFDSSTSARVHPAPSPELAAFKLALLSSPVNKWETSNDEEFQGGYNQAGRTIQQEEQRPHEQAYPNPPAPQIVWL